MISPSGDPLVYCWTHARRRCVKRLDKDGAPIAEEALCQIAELYAMEKTGRGARCPPRGTTDPLGPHLHRVKPRRIGL